MTKPPFTPYRRVAIVVFLLFSLLGLSQYTLGDFIAIEPDWTAAELETLASLAILPEPNHLLPRQDPSNQYSQQEAAALLGHKLFFDPRFSINGKISCASCHQPDQFFTDSKPVASAGISPTQRHTPTVVGSAQSPWLFWDGRKDSLWAQALGPLESSVEHGGSRTQYVQLISQYYRQDYEAIFGPLPDFSDHHRFPPQPDARPGQACWQKMAPADQAQVTAVFVNMGKAIAAYEAKLQPAPGRFDGYVAQLLQGPAHHQQPLDHSANATLLSPQEIAGLKLFIDDNKGQCLRCHNGPLFTNHDFQATAVPMTTPEGKADTGRALGIHQVLADEFNCFSEHSDASADQCDELRFAKTTGIELEAAFKVPTLRNISQTAPYMNQGQFKTLKEVLGYYNRAATDGKQHSELMPLHLFPHELQQIEAFLQTLNGGIAAESHWLSNPHLPALQRT